MSNIFCWSADFVTSMDSNHWPDRQVESDRLMNKMKKELERVAGSDITHVPSSPVGQDPLGGQTNVHSVQVSILKWKYGFF